MFVIAFYIISNWIKQSDIEKNLLVLLNEIIRYNHSSQHLPVLNRKIEFIKNYFNFQISSITNFNHHSP